MTRILYGHEQEWVTFMYTDVESSASHIIKLKKKKESKEENSMKSKMKKQDVHICMYMYTLFKVLGRSINCE